jgi:hypothetical protein
MLLHLSFLPEALLRARGLGRLNGLLGLRTRWSDGVQCGFNHRSIPRVLLGDLDEVPEELKGILVLIEAGVANCDPENLFVALQYSDTVLLSWNDKFSLQ